MMLPSPTLALKMAVPAAFFGYALIANLSLISAPGAMLPVAGGVLDGRVTQSIDRLYRDNLPHKPFAVGLIGAARYLLLGEGRSGVVLGREGHLFTAEEFRQVDDTVYTAALGRIEQAAARLEAMDVQLVVVPLPAKIDLLRDTARDAVAADALETLYRRFLTDMRSTGISVVDSRPALAALSAPFLVTDTHWTPDGARAVAASIAASGVIPAGEDIFAIEPGTRTAFAGDLVSYVTSDAMAPFLGLSPESVTPYRALAVADADEAGALDLFGDAGGETDLVGTSYSANPNWSFAEALKLELNRDVINHAEEGMGPFQPMLTYLDRLDPLALPQTVIWEIPVRYLTDPELLPGEDGA